MAQPGLKLEAGQFFGTRFQIQGLLGKGAMGVVYRALDHEAQREVALKILSSSANPATVQRFVREGELTAALRHPGIVTVHSGGAVGSYPYLAYELVPDARTLDDLFPRLDHLGRAALVLRVAEAIGYAHERGIIHRDLKPENVLVTPEGEPRVADFGLASGRDLDRLTQSGAMVGTPSYMSPEQISGNREAIGAPSDVWSLGVILYEALTGRLPFEGDSLLSLAATVMRDDPPPLRGVDPAIPEALETVCLAAIRREPEQRYPDANALAEDLRAALRGERPSAGSSSTFERALGTPGSRRRQLTTVLAALTSALALLLGGVWFALRPDPARPSLAPQARATPADPAQAARKAWTEVKAEPSPLDQLLAAEAWLGSYPESPLRPEVLEFARLQAERQAIRHLSHERVSVLEFTSPTTLMSAGPGGLRAWDLSHASDTPIWVTSFGSMSFFGGTSIGRGRFLISIQGGVYLASQEGTTLLDKTLRGQWVAMAYDPASRRLATGRVTGKLTCGTVDVEGRYLDRRVLGSKFDYYRSLDLSRGGRYLVAGTGTVELGCGICLWDLKKLQQTPGSLQPEKEFPIGFEVDRIRFTPDEKEVILIGDGGGVHLLSLETGALRSLTSESIRGSVPAGSRVAHLGRVKGVMFLADGRLVTYSRGSKLAGSGLNGIGLWDLASGAELASLTPRPIRYRCLALSPDGARLAIGLERKIELRSGWVIPGEALAREHPR